MLHLFSTWTLLFLLGMLVAGDRGRPRNLVILLEPIHPANPILNGCGPGCAVLPMRVAHVMKGKGSGWGSECGCGDAGLLAGPPPDREDYDDFGFEDFIEDDGDDGSRSFEGMHGPQCNTTICTGKFRGNLAKFSGVSVIWSAGYGREFSLLNVTQVRFAFQATSDAACFGQYVNSTGVAAMDELHANYTVIGNFISVGQCPTCTKCSIAAAMEVRIQNGTAGSLFHSREARITTDFNNEFSWSHREFMWNMTNYSALSFEGQSLVVKDFDFFSYKKKKYQLPQSEKAWGILEMDEEDRKTLAVAIVETEVIKFANRFEAFVLVNESDPDFETQLPALHHLTLHSAKKLRIAHWGSKCKKAIVHTRIPNATTLALMGLQAPNVSGTPSFLLSVDRMDDTGALVNEAIFKFRVYHPNCTRLKVFSYHGITTEPTDITAEGGNSTLVTNNGTFEIAVLRTSTFVGYAVADPEVVAQPQGSLVASPASSPSTSVSPSPTAPAASPAASSAESPVMVMVLAGVGASIAVLVVLGGAWLYCRRQRLALSPREHMVSADSCPFEPPAKYLV